jgi:VWFA-related protein
MFFGRRTALFIMFTLALAYTAQSFQQKEPAQQAVIRVNVNIVQVDATVTNSNDEPVTDLKAEEFVILQDGQPQEITNFSFIRKRESAKPAAAAIKPAIEAPKSASIPPPPPAPLKREKVGRSIALVVDDLGLSYTSMDQVRQSIRKWIDEEMQPEDAVALILTGKGEGALQQFTNNKRILQAAVEQRVQYNTASRVGVLPLTQTVTMSTGSKDSRGFASANPQEERNLAFTKFTMQSIQNVVNGLKTLPGRKDLIIFSENMTIMFESDPGVSQGRDLHMKEMLQNTVDLANKYAVVIHSIDPRGVMPVNSAEDSLSQYHEDDVPAEGMASITDKKVTQLNNSRDGMVKLAKETGGLFIHDRNDTFRALEKVVEDGEGYYLIGYQPDESTVGEMKSGRAKYHNIQVRVKRPGLQVRTRSRFFSTPESISSPDIMARKERIQEAIESPFASGSLRVRLTALYSQTKKDKPCITALLHFGAGQLTFSKEPDGWLKAPVEIVAGLYDINGQQVEFIDKVWTLQIKESSYERMKKNGISALINVPVKESGSYQMKVVMRDIKSGQLGSAMHFVEVPDARKKKLALSGIALAANQLSAKVADEQEEGIIEDSGMNETPAVRIFEPGEEISWAYQILNARTDKDQNPKLQTQIRLFHEGREVYAGKPSEMKLGAQGNTKRMIAVDQLKLTKLPPGYYVLQVAVTDMLADLKDGMAVQSIDFEVKNPSAKNRPASAF